MGMIDIPLSKICFQCERRGDAGIGPDRLQNLTLPSHSGSAWPFVRCELTKWEAEP